MNGQAVSNGSLKRRANELIRQALDDGRVLPLFCECDDIECLRTVWVAPEVYDRAAAEPVWRLLAVHPDGHAGGAPASVAA